MQFFANNSAVNHLLSGLFAEVISCALWLPIDVIKERLQVQSELNNIYSYKGPLDAAKKISRSEGPVGLYRVNINYTLRLMEPLFSFLGLLVLHFLSFMKK